MILGICTLVFLLLARLRFPSSKSIPKIIKDRYGESVIKLVCQFERTDLRRRKAEFFTLRSLYILKFQIEA